MFSVGSYIIHLSLLCPGLDFCHCWGQGDVWAALALNGTELRSPGGPWPIAQNVWAPDLGISLGKGLRGPVSPGQANSTQEHPTCWVGYMKLKNQGLCFIRVQQWEEGIVTDTVLAVQCFFLKACLWIILCFFLAHQFSLLNK